MKECVSRRDYVDTGGSMNVQDRENRIYTLCSDTFRHDHCFRLRGHVDSECLVNVQYYIVL